MTPKSRPLALLTRSAYDDLKKLPGNVRRQMIVAIDELEKDPRPSNSKQLVLENESREIRRLRIGKWRIIYLILNKAPLILGIRRRPPYNYSDIETMIEAADE